MDMNQIGAFCNQIAAVETSVMLQRRHVIIETKKSAYTLYT